MFDVSNWSTIITSLLNSWISNIIQFQTFFLFKHLNLRINLQYYCNFYYNWHNLIFTIFLILSFTIFPFIRVSFSRFTHKINSTLSKHFVHLPYTANSQNSPPTSAMFTIDLVPRRKSINQENGWAVTTRKSFTRREDRHARAIDRPRNRLLDETTLFFYANIRSA